MPELRIGNYGGNAEDVFGIVVNYEFLSPFLNFCHKFLLAQLTSCTLEVAQEVSQLLTELRAHDT